MFRTLNVGKLKVVCDESSTPQNLISAITVKEMLRYECQRYLALVMDTTTERTSNSDVPIACEFLMSS